MKKINFSSLNHLQGFTLLELLITLFIVLILWGSVGQVLMRTQRSLKAILAQTQNSYAASLAIQKFEKDINRFSKNMKGDLSGITFQIPSGKISYRFRDGKLYRDQEGISQVGREFFSECHWVYFSEGIWQNKWDQAQAPQVVLFEFKIDQETFRTLCPIRMRE